MTTSAPGATVADLHVYSGDEIPAGLPAGTTMPYGLMALTLTGAGGFSATVQVTVQGNLTAEDRLYKYLPTCVGGVATDWAWHDITEHAMVSGVQDGDEEGEDCGGPCSPCNLSLPSPICTCSGSTPIFTVDDTADLIDSSPGDGACLSAGGTCTLRAAIHEANVLAAPVVCVQVPAGVYQLTIPAGTPAPIVIPEEDDVTMGDLDVTTPICIKGVDRNEVVIRGGGEVGRPFHIHETAVSTAYPGVWFERFTIDGSYAPAHAGPSLINDMVAQPECNSGEDDCSGGAIRNEGWLTLVELTISANASNGQGNGILNTNTGDLRIFAGFIKDNVDMIGHGGGILNAGALNVRYFRVSVIEAHHGHGSARGVRAVGLASTRPDPVGSPDVHRPGARSMTPPPSSPVHVDVEVRFRDLDALNHVNNAVYFTFMETARVAYLREILPEGAATGDPAHAFPFLLAEASCRFLAPATLGQVVRVGIRVSRMGNKSFDFAYQLSDRDTGTVFAEARSVQVAYDHERRESIPIPEELRGRISALEGGS